MKNTPLPPLKREDKESSSGKTPNPKTCCKFFVLSLKLSLAIQKDILFTFLHM
jgi:hypothetical protein